VADPAPPPPRSTPPPEGVRVGRTGQPRRGRRLAFAALAAALTLTVLEALSWVTLSVVEGVPASWGRLAARRGALAGPAEPAGGEDPDAPRPGVEEVPPWAVGLDTLHILHPYLGFVEPPDPPWKGNATRWDANAAAFGFPRNFHPFFPAGEVDRVVVAVVGGSVAQQVALNGRPVPYLEEALGSLDRFRGRRVAVLDLAMGGYKQPQQLIALSYFLSLGLPVGVVVNVDGFNEVTLPVRDNLPSGVFPFYPRAWNFQVGDIDPVERRARGAVVLLEDARRSLALRADHAPWRHSFTAGLLWRLLDGRLERWTADRRQSLLDREPGTRDPQSFGPQVSFESEEDLRRELVAVWRRSSLLMDRLARGHGVEYYHFLQPNQYDPGSKRLSAEERISAFDPSSPFRDLVARGYPLLRSAGEELRGEGVAFVDLSRELASVDATLYVDPCCHLNRAGIRLLVDRIAATVAAGPSDAGSH